jgi:serine/threonine protein phosphatase PrpC
MRWSSASLTDAGAVHSVNQDACLDLPVAGLWVVADGVGGHNEGDIASRLIVDTLSHTGGHDHLSDFVNEVEDRLQEVHKTLVNRAASRDKNMIIGSTVAALLVVEQYGVCLWAGDSRIYRYRDGQLEQLTRDHSQVEELIEHGGLLREEAENHPHANVITRAVGAGEELFLDVELQQLCNADRYLICSDGLYKEVNEMEIAEHMKYGDCVTICRTLVALALERGAHDNVTVVAIKFDAV